MSQFLLILEVILSLLLIFIVLIQNKNVSLNLSTMAGGMWAVTKRGPEKVLHQATIVIGIMFIINSLALFLVS